MNTKSIDRNCVCAILLASIFAATATADIIYVRPGGSGSQDGTSWAHAYAELQTALLAAPADSEIWVAAGTYKPDLGSGDRTVSFLLRNDIAIYGGFNGSETERAQRNFAANVTILSGDINALGTAEDNAYHVVKADGLNTSAVLDGFTVEDGYAFNAPLAESFAAGVLVSNATPTLRNLIIQDCVANSGGGMGVVFYQSNGLILTNITFQRNVAVPNPPYGGGGGLDTSQTNTIYLNQCNFLDNAARIGGGMAVGFGSQVVLNGGLFSGNNATVIGGAYRHNNDTSASFTDVTFADNSAGQAGGGVYVSFSPATFVRCTFRRNSAGTSGGGLYVWDDTAVLRNCEMFGNDAVQYGGALYANSNASVWVEGCAIVGNTAGDFGGVVQDTGTLAITNSTVTQNQANGLIGGVFLTNNATGTYANSIFWNNADANGNSSSTSQISWVLGNPPPSFEYCDINGVSGPTLFAVNPTFFREPTPGTDGIWGSADDDYGDLRLGCTSILNDAGDNSVVPAELTMDLAGEPRFADNPHVANTGPGNSPMIDIGAFESQPTSACGTCFLPNNACVPADPANCQLAGGVYVGDTVACGGAVLFVAQSAGPGGDGTLQMPFAQFAAASSATPTNQSTALIVLEAGHYVEGVSFVTPIRIFNATGATIRIGQ